MTRREWLMAGLLLLLAVLSLLVPRCADAALPTGYYGRAVLTTPTLGDTYYDTPVLFRADVGNFPRMDGDAGDIRVYSLAGNMLPHEIAEITADSVTIWFEADTLATGRQFYVYSGNDSPPTALDPSSTWDTAAAVFHYDEVPTNGATLDDSAGNTDAYASGNWLPAYKTSGNAVSEVGSAWFNDNFRGVHVPDLNVTGDWTIMAWLRPVGASTDVIAQGNPWWWFVSAQASNTNPQPSFVARYGTWNVSYAYTGCANDGTTALYAVTFTTSPDTALTVYRNGVECTNSAIYEYGGANFGSSDISGWYELGYDIDLQGQNFTEGRTNFGIASQSFWNSGNQQDQYNGFVDEYAIYTSALSAEQIADMYANQLEPNSWWGLDYHFNLTNPTVADGSSTKPDPVITAISGPLNVNFERVVITGENFGTHTMDFADLGIGPDGFIERNALGTVMSSLETDDYWTFGYRSNLNGASPAAMPSDDAAITDAVVKTGSKAIDCSSGTTAEGRNGTPTNSKQRMVAYMSGGAQSNNGDIAFGEFYASYWFYERIFNAPVLNMGQKLFFFGSYNYHAGTGSLNLVTDNNTRLDNQPWSHISFEGFGAYYNALEFRIGETTSQSYNLDGSAPNPQSSVGSYPGRFWGYPEYLPRDGTWHRIEMWGKINTLDPSTGYSNEPADGKFEMYSTGPWKRAAVAIMPRVEYRDSRDNTRSSSFGVPTYSGSLWNSWAIQNFHDDNNSPDGLLNQEVDVFVDDVYLQFGTQARVELGNASTLANCTKLFAQKIIEWQDGRIEIELNHGDFELGDVVYLFVIDEFGNAASKIMPPDATTRPQGPKTPSVSGGE